MMSERAGRHGLYAYPWDMAEQEPEGFVAELHAAGIDTLCLATAYHAGKFLRPHGADGHVYFPEDGAVHCRVRPERYGRIRPSESEVARAGDPFGRKVADITRAGIDGISFYNFGHLRRSHLGWIGRALAAAKETPA